MIPAQDIKSAAGIILVRRNTELTESVIDKLHLLGVTGEVEILDDSIISIKKDEPEVNTELPQGQETAKGYIVDIPLENSKFFYAGNLIINADVKNCKIKSSGSIVVTGNVQDSDLISKAGGINVLGIAQSYSGKNVIKGEKNIKIKTAKFYTLEANGDLEVEEELFKCTVKVGGSVNAPKATFTLTNVEAVEKITLFMAGEEKKTNMVLSINFNNMKKLFQRAMIIDETVHAYERDIDKLKKSLEIIKLLGDKVRSLPEEKQQQIKEQNQLYIKYSQAIDTLLKEKSKIIQILKLLKDNEEPVVRVLGFIFPSVEIHLDKARFTMQSIEKNVGFYKKGIVRMKKYASV